MHFVLEVNSLSLMEVNSFTLDDDSPTRVMVTSLFNFPFNSHFNSHFNSPVPLSFRSDWGL